MSYLASITTRTAGEKEDKFKAIMEESHIPFILLSCSGDILSANSSFHNLFGYTIEELNSKSIIDLFVDRKAYRIVRNKVRELGWLKDREVKLTTKKGVEITGLLSLSIRKSENGKTVGYQGIFHDITERKMSEDILRNISTAVAADIGSEFFYSLVKSLSKYLDVKYAIISTLGDVKSKRIKTLAVCSKGEILENFEYNFTAPPPEKIMQTHLCVYNESVLKNLASSGLFNKTDIKSHLCIPLLDSNKHLLGMLLVLDTKPLKNAEIAETMLKIFSVRASAELERERAKIARIESEEKYRLVVQNANDAILLMEGTRIQFFNPKAVELTGYPEQELVNKNFFELLHCEEKGKVAYSFSKMKKNENPVLDSFQIKDKNGEVKWVEANLVTVNWQGTPSCLLFLNDVTKRKGLQDELAQAQRLESAGRVAGQIAHDFNNLLSPLTAYPALIREEISNKRNCLEMLNEIEQAAEKLAQINQQLLALGRRGHYTMEKVDLKELIVNTILSLKLSKTVKLRKFFRSDLYLIKGGVVQLGRVFMNILQNAAEAMDNSGTLRISARNVVVKNTLKGYYSVRPGDYVRIDFKDTGSGIDAEIEKRIFEPFFTTKKMDKKRGSGLGLSIVHGIIEDHNAYLTVDSKIGKGTIFSVYLPALKRAKKTVRRIVEKRVSGDENILIVDDDPVQRKVASQLLKRLGYGVHVLSTGEGAIRHFRRKSYDLVIMDMIMTGIDGVETYRQILEIQPNQRAIIVSGYAMSNKVKQAQKLGAGSFVTKPITRKALAEAVRHELDRKISHHSFN